MGGRGSLECPAGLCTHSCRSFHVLVRPQATYAQTGCWRHAALAGLAGRACAMAKRSTVFRNPTWFCFKSPCGGAALGRCPRGLRSAGAPEGSCPASCALAAVLRPERAGGRSEPLLVSLRAPGGGRAHEATSSSPLLPRMPLPSRLGAPGCRCWRGDRARPRCGIGPNACEGE